MLSKQEIVMRILLAIILGGAIGLERQSKHRPAGFKTHILVCVGSATVMVLSESIFRKYYLEFGIMSDPARLGAQVISGVGFLGAGTIIHHGPNVRGLTTAASLWTVAALGLAAGAGFYFLAFVVAVSIYLILFIFQKLYFRLREASDVSNLQIELLNKPKALGAINLVLARNEVKIIDMQFINPDGDEENLGNVIIIFLTIKLPYNDDIFLLIDDIEKIAGIISVDRA